MTVFERRPVLRWLVPVVAALALALGGTALGVISAAARGGLPHRSASQLLVDVQRARVDGFSGTVVQNADLGLPSLPGTGGNGSSDMSSMIAGSHTLRLWYGGPDKVRLALLGSLGESDVVRNGSNLWTWSSKTKSATHHTVPADKGTAPKSLAEASPLTPQQAADQALKAITPSTKVSTSGTAVVAGRSAYELVLQPRDRASLVSSVRIAIDGATHIPLRVQVYGSDTGKPALEVGFTSFDPTTPDPTVYRFNPPPGTKVTQGSTPAKPSGPAGKNFSKQAAADRPDIVGSGWTTVVVAKVPASAGSNTGSNMGSNMGTLGALTKQLPAVSGPWGSGHVLRGTLFSAVLTNDGRVAVGAVAPNRLYAALARR
jgi:outer membrane lipoprotein-sorting protein